MTTIEAFKQAAAEQSLELVQSGMALGLGSGTTAAHMLQGLAARLKDGRLRDIVGVPTSERTARMARQLGIPLTTLDDRPELDLALDGADEIDPNLNLIKGLGGALLHEKVVAAAARRFVVFADERKLVSGLGTRAPLPVEVLAFAATPVARRLAALGATPSLRRAADGSAFITDEGNVILDCQFAAIPEPAALSTALHAIPGVVGHGLFLGMAERAFVAGANGVQVLVVSR